MACIACGSVLNGIYKHAPLTTEQLADARHRDREIVIITSQPSSMFSTNPPSTVKKLLEGLHDEVVTDAELLRFMPSFEMVSDADDSDRRHLVTWEGIYAMRNSIGGLRYLIDGGMKADGTNADRLGSLRSFNGSDDQSDRGKIDTGCVTVIGEEGLFSVALGMNSVVTGLYSTIAGGGALASEGAGKNARTHRGNLITAAKAFIASGDNNQITGTSDKSFIAAGGGNYVNDSEFAFIHGTNNSITHLYLSMSTDLDTSKGSHHSTILNGEGNAIDAGGHNSIIGGTYNNIRGIYYSYYYSDYVTGFNIAIGGQSNTLLYTHKGVAVNSTQSMLYRAFESSLISSRQGLISNSDNSAVNFSLASRVVGSKFSIVNGGDHNHIYGGEFNVNEGSSNTTLLNTSVGLMLSSRSSSVSFGALNSIISSTDSNINGYGNNASLACKSITRTGTTVTVTFNSEHGIPLNSDIKFNLSCNDINTTEGIGYLGIWDGTVLTTKTITFTLSSYIIATTSEFPLSMTDFSVTNFVANIFYGDMPVNSSNSIINSRNAIITASTNSSIISSLSDHVRITKASNSNIIAAHDVTDIDELCHASLILNSTGRSYISKAIIDGNTIYSTSASLISVIESNITGSPTSRILFSTYSFIEGGSVSTIIASVSSSIRYTNAGVIMGTRTGTIYTSDDSHITSVSGSGYIYNSPLSRIIGVHVGRIDTSGESSIMAASGAYISTSARAHILSSHKSTITSSDDSNISASGTGQYQGFYVSTGNGTGYYPTVKFCDPYITNSTGAHISDSNGAYINNSYNARISDSSFSYINNNENGRISNSNSVYILDGKRSIIIGSNGDIKNSIWSYISGSYDSTIGFSRRSSRIKSSTGSNIMNSDNAFIQTSDYSGIYGSKNNPTLWYVQNSNIAFSDTSSIKGTANNAADCTGNNILTTYGGSIYNINGFDLSANSNIIGSDFVYIASSRNSSIISSNGSGNVDSNTYISKSKNNSNLIASTSSHISNASRGNIFGSFQSSMDGNSNVADSVSVANDSNGILFGNNATMYNSTNSVIVGGYTNSMTNIIGGVIVGGTDNIIINSSYDNLITDSFIIGGYIGEIRDSRGSFIVGGSNNKLNQSKQSSIITSYNGLIDGTGSVNYVSNSIIGASDASILYCAQSIITSSNNMDISNSNNTFIAASSDNTGSGSTSILKSTDVIIIGSTDTRIQSSLNSGILTSNVGSIIREANTATIISSALTSIVSLDYDNRSAQTLIASSYAVKITGVGVVNSSIICSSGDDSNNPITPNSDAYNDLNSGYNTTTQDDTRIHDNVDQGLIAGSYKSYIQHYVGNGSIISSGYSYILGSDVVINESKFSNAQCTITSSFRSGISGNVVDGIISGSYQSYITNNQTVDISNSVMHPLILSSSDTSIIGEAISHALIIGSNSCYISQVGTAEISHALILSSYRSYINNIGITDAMSNTGILSSSGSTITASTGANIIASNGYDDFGNFINKSDRSNIIGSGCTTIDNGYSNLILGGEGHTITTYQYSVKDSGTSSIYLSRNNLIAGGRECAINDGAYCSILGGMRNAMQRQFITKMVSYSNVGGVITFVYDPTLYPSVQNATNAVVYGTGGAFDDVWVMGTSGVTVDTAAHTIKINGLSPSLFTDLVSTYVIKLYFIAYGDVHTSVISGGSYNSIYTDQNSPSENTNVGVFIGGGGYNAVGEVSSYSSIMGGKSNAIHYGAEYSSIVGGKLNSILQGAYGFIGGGANNSISDTGSNNSSIVGGSYNIIRHGTNNSFIGGGYINTIESNTTPNSGIVSGESNYIKDAASHSFIGGGKSNTIEGGAAHSSIVGGELNDIASDATHSSIVGGSYNIIRHGTNNSFIGGGYINTIESNTTPNSGIVSGESNYIKDAASHSFIGGGKSNTIKDGAAHSSIVGGELNAIASGATHSSIGGGYSNKLIAASVKSGIASGSYGIIGYIHGVFQSHSSDGTCFIGGGYNNSIGTSNSSFIGGGYSNSIDCNINSSIIAGGTTNSIINACATNDSFYVTGGAPTGQAQSTISGGYNNSIYFNNGNTVNNVIGGGASNSIGQNPDSPYKELTDNVTANSVIAGGLQNLITTTITGSSACVISGGANNIIKGHSQNCIIAGGYGNHITDSDDCGIMGKYTNITSSFRSFIIGTSITVTGYSDTTFVSNLYSYGDVKGLNAYTTTSDARMKVDIVDLTQGVDFINSLRPVSYKCKDGGITEELDATGIPTGKMVPVPGKRTHFGLIAQEVRSVVDGLGIDFGGHVIENDITNPDSMQALRYTEFISPLIKAVQELSAKIKELEEKLNNK